MTLSMTLFDFEGQIVLDPISSSVRTKKSLYTAP